MKLIAAIILTAGLAMSVIGLVGVVRPFGRVPTRKRAAGWIGGGLIAIIVAFLVGPEPEPKSMVTASSAPVVEKRKDGAFAAAESAFAALAECQQEPDADCSKEEAAAEAAQVVWERRVDEISAKIDGKTDCIKRELGERFDEADLPEMIAARKKCGIDDPADVEEQLSEQRDRLSR